MLVVAGQKCTPVLAECSSDGGRVGAPLNMLIPGTHCLECWCSPGKDTDNEDTSQ